MFLNDKCWKLIVGILVGEGVERTAPYLSNPHVPPPRPPNRLVDHIYQFLTFNFKFPAISSSNFVQSRINNKYGGTIR